MTKPWIGRTKSACDTAVDIAVKLPAILEAWETAMCQSQSSGIDERTRTLKERSWQLNAELTHWYDEYITLYKSTFADSAELKLLYAGKDNPTLLPDVLIQQGIAPLYAMTIYWTCCTLLYDIMVCCICLTRSTKMLLEPSAGLASSTMFSGTAVARVLCSYSTRGIQTKAESEDMQELERCLQDPVWTGGSMWSQTWKKVMKQVETMKFARRGTLASGRDCLSVVHLSTSQ
jgi:hypothetical protein